LLYQQDLLDYHSPAAPSTDVKTTAVSEPTTPKEKEAPAIQTSTHLPPVTESGSAGEFSYGYSVSSHPFRTLFSALILLGIPTSLFLWCGGMRWLRRVFKGKGKDRSKYRRVGDADLEK